MLEQPNALDTYVRSVRSPPAFGDLETLAYSIHGFFSSRLKVSKAIVLTLLPLKSEL